MMPDPLFPHLFRRSLIFVLALGLFGCASSQRSEEYRAFGISDEELPPPPALNLPADEADAPPLRIRPSPSRPGLPAMDPPAAARTPPPLPLPAAPLAAEPPVDADILRFLEGWRAAWAGRDVAGYLAHYTPDYRGGADTAKDWRDGRQRVLTGGGSLDIRLGPPDIRRDGDRAEVYFEQDFHSPKFSDRVRKHLSLVRRNGNWLIERERFTPIEDTAK